MSEDNSESMIAGENHAGRLYEFKKYYDDLPVVIIVLNSDRKIIYANNEMRRLSGADDGALIGAAAGGILGCINSFKDPRGCGYSDNCRCCPLFKAINEVFQSGLPQKDITFNPELFINGDNKKISFICTVNSVGNYLLLCFNDITKVKIIERESLENKDRLGLIFKMSPDAILITRADNGFIVNANDRFCELSGYTSEEINGKTTLELNIFDAADRAKMVKSIMESGCCDNIEQTFTVKSGKKITGLLSIRIINLDDTKHLISVFRDITDRKKIEDDLRISEKRFRTILNAYTAGFFIADKNLNIIEVNDQYCRMSGYSREELLKLKAIDIEAEENDEEHNKHSVRIIQTGYDRFETKHIKKNGEVYDVEMSISFESESGQFLAFATDISVRKTYEKAIIEAKKTAEEASGAKSQFLANMSHEIRTPLNSIIGYTDLLSLDVNLSGEPKEFIDSINFSARSLLTIINDILDLAKIEAGKLTLEEAMIDLFKLLEQTMNVFKLSALGKNLDLILSIDPAVPRYMKADQTRLRQVLINLISNAVKFTEAGEVKLNVSFIAGVSGDTGAFTFTARDTGIGIGENERKMLFKSFSQGDASVTRKFGGTGLGLVISSLLVKKMGGEIDLKSRRGIGSEFYFTLSRNFEREPNAAGCCGYKNYSGGSARALAPSGAEINSGAPVAVDFNNKSAAAACEVKADNVSESVRPYVPIIMIAEDSPMNMKLFSSIFKKIAPSAVVICAEDGAAGLELYKERKPDIIFMDIQMPVMDGYEATKKIREFEKLPPAGKKTVIIALTASAIKGEEEKCLQAGMDGFMSKPLDYKALKDIIEKYVEKIAAD